MCKISSSRIILQLILYITIVSNSSVFAQYDSLLHKPYSINVSGIHSMYNDLIEIHDSLQRDSKAREIKNFARQHNDRSLELNVDFFLNYWNAFFQKQPKEISLNKLTKQLELLTEENIDFLRARSLRALAEFYWKIEKNYELAFEQYLLLDLELRNTKAEDYPEMARDLMQIGEAYYYFQDFKVARSYFKRAIEIPENLFNTVVINAAKNNLGLCYQQENILDSADYYFKSVISTVSPEALVWQRIATGNLGVNHYLRKQYDDAIELLLIDFEGAVKENDYGCAAGASITLADIYLSKNQLNKSLEYIGYANEYIHKAEQPDRFRLLYPIMSKWFAATGNINESFRYIDSSIIALNKYNEKFSALKMLRAQQKLDHQQKLLQEAERNKEKARKMVERGVLLFSLIILIIVILLSYFIQKKRQLEKDLKLQKATQELEKARLTLDRFTERIQEKNRIIEELEVQIGKSSEEDQKLLSQLQRSTILTEEDWQNFKLVFEQMHGGFLMRLKEKYPQFTQAEIRFISLAKLNFTTKEMAAALGVSPQSIRTNWYRIRKKLNLQEDATIESLVASI